MAAESISWMQKPCSNGLKNARNVEINYHLHFIENFCVFGTFHKSCWSASNIGTLPRSRHLRYLKKKKKKRIRKGTVYEDDIRPKRSYNKSSIFFYQVILAQFLKMFASVSIQLV